MHHDLTGKVAAVPSLRANRQTRRSRRWLPSAVLVGALGVAAPLTMLASPAGAATPVAGGYTLVTSEGGTFNFGTAPVDGGPLGVADAATVGVAPTPDGKGYWVATSNGGVFTFGDAQFYGSAGNLKLTAPIVGIVATADGKGYYLVSSNGGVFTFGDALVLRLGGQPQAGGADRGYVGDRRRHGLLPGGVRRWGVHLR